jgi:hypothetical protein
LYRQIGCSKSEILFNICLDRTKNSTRIEKLKITKQNSKRIVVFMLA